MTGFAAELRAGETRAGLDHLDDILGVDGVDGVFIGPYDLALSLGQDSVLEDAVLAAITSVIDRTSGRGRITGIFTGNRDLTALLPTVDLLGVDTTPPPCAPGFG
jgi:4-hydroxy-2-oxoheptanedioate aldolase